jgi:hypothetical protein
MHFIHKIGPQVTTEYVRVFLLSVLKVKVKVTLKQATKAQRGVEVEHHSFFNFGAIWGWVVNTTPRPLYLR